MRHGCARDNVDYALIRTSKPLDAALDRVFESPADANGNGRSGFPA